MNRMSLKSATLETAPELAVPAVKPPASPRLPWLTLAVVVGAAFMDTLDVGIVTVDLPAIQRSLDAGYTIGQWLIASYTLSFAVLLITGGRLGDLYGRRRIFLLGVAGFTAASLGCGLAPSAEVLITFRFIQGGFGALMAPQVLAMVQVLFPPERRGGAFVVYGTALNVAQICGPILGGLIATADIFGLGWRPIFLINLPVGVVILLCGRAMLKESMSDRPMRFDPAGVIMIAVISVLFMYPLVQGRESGWPPWMIAALIAAVPMLRLFAWYQEVRGPYASLVPTTLFHQPAFVIGTVLMVLVYTSFSGVFIIVIWNVQIALGWTPLQTALPMLGWVVGTFVFGVPAVTFAPKIGRTLLGIGCVIVAGGMIFLGEIIRTEAGDLQAWHLFAGLTATGCGLGLVVPILVDLVLAGVPPEDAGAGGGVANAVLYFAAAAGIGLAGVLFFGEVGRGGAHAEALVPQMRADLSAQAIPASQQEQILATFRACFRERAIALNPDENPASCRTPQAADPAVINALARAAEDNFADATSTTLRYQAAGFLLSVLLAPLLPRGNAGAYQSHLLGGRHRVPGVELVGMLGRHRRRPWLAISGGRHRPRLSGRER